MGDLLPKLRRALGLPDDASKSDIVAAFNTIIDTEEDDVAARDPRVKLRRLADRRATEKGIAFGVALSEICREKPQLTEDVRNFYAREK